MSENNLPSTFEVIGCMSGSSLDGLDLAHCRFTFLQGVWTFECTATDTVKYNAQFASRFIKAMHGPAIEIARLHKDLGEFIGQSVAQFTLDKPAHLVASHGHTVFHRPEEGFSTQIGCGARIAARSGLPTVCDFRSTDLAMDGQGAPLVPMGESLLFPDHSAFLNLGGIANVSIHGDIIQGFDVCICNQMLNALAFERGIDYDDNGEIARSGKIDESLFSRLEELSFFSKEPPKSLGREFFQEEIAPLLRESKASIPDKLHTATEHIASRIGAALNGFVAGDVLVTGGGAFNSYLLERIEAATDNSLVTPSKEIIGYKEAIIFAFLGLLRYLEQPNTLASVTGAHTDTSGGCIYLPPSTA